MSNTLKHLTKVGSIAPLVKVRLAHPLLPPPLAAPPVNGHQCRFRFRNIFRPYGIEIFVPHLVCMWYKIISPPTKTKMADSGQNDND